MADNVEEIKSRLGIYDVVSQYVQLKKAGHNYKGLCPFHSEKTPSFVVSPEKQICHCFGCQKGGDIFTFIEEVEGVGFSEAMQILADKAGVKLEKKAIRAEDKSEKEEFFKAHDLAAEFFEKQLWETNDGKKVLKYLHNRGLKDETIRQFRIGFAPDSYNDLHSMLLKRGIKKSTLLKSGLASSKKVGDEEIYDKYRSRLIFPIFNYLGNICGFGGRALKKDQMPKYLNSAENIIYNKSKVMYGLSHAKAAIKEMDQVVLVEGYFDVVVPMQEGVRNVVATSGTALTKEQVKKLSHLTKNVVSCFDSDNAGFDATKRAYPLLLDAEMMMKTVTLGDEKDPADFVLDKSGVEFLKVVSEARDFMEFYFDKLLSVHDRNAFSGQRQILSEVLPFYKRMSTAGRDFYVRQLAQKLNISSGALNDEIDHFQLPKEHPVNKVVDARERKFILPELILAIVLAYPKLFQKFFDMPFQDLLDGELESIYKIILDQYNSSRLSTGNWDFDGQFSPETRREIDILVLYGQDKCSELSDEAIVSYVQKLIDRGREDSRNSQLKGLQLKISEAEQSGDKDALMKLLKQQQELLSK